MMQDYCKPPAPAGDARGRQECGRVLRTDGKCENAHVLPEKVRAKVRTKVRKNA